MFPICNCEGNRLLRKSPGAGRRTAWSRHAHTAPSRVCAGFGQAAGAGVLRPGQDRVARLPCGVGRFPFPVLHRCVVRDQRPCRPAGGLSSGSSCCRSAALVHDQLRRDPPSQGQAKGGALGARGEHKRLHWALVVRMCLGARKAQDGVLGFGESSLPHRVWSGYGLCSAWRTWKLRVCVLTCSPRVNVSSISECLADKGAVPRKRPSGSTLTFNPFIVVPDWTTP